MKKAWVPAFWIAEAQSVSPLYFLSFTFQTSYFSVQYSKSIIHILPSFPLLRCVIYSHFSCEQGLQNDI